MSEQELKVGQKWRNRKNGRTVKLVEVHGDALVVRGASMIHRSSEVDIVVDRTRFLEVFVLVTELESLQAERDEIIPGHALPTDLTAEDLDLKDQKQWVDIRQQWRPKATPKKVYEITDILTGRQGAEPLVELRNIDNGERRFVVRLGELRGDYEIVKDDPIEIAMPQQDVGMRPEHGTPYGEMGDIERSRAEPLAAEMLSDLGYVFDGQSWVFHGGAGAADKAHAGQATLRRLGYEWKGGSEWAPPIGKAPPFTAPDLLDRAADHMRDRAATYDKPEGERSMAAAVAAFNAQTSRNLTAAEGWLLMVNLKIVRDRQRPEPHRDSVEDLVAYGALYGEARLERVL